VLRDEPTLLEETLTARKELAIAAPAVAGHAPAVNPATGPAAPPEGTTQDQPKARLTRRHCGGQRLHAQHVRVGYFVKCIECLGNTPISQACTGCGKAAKVRKAADEFFRECKVCGFSELIHVNVPLDGLEDPQLGRLARNGGVSGDGGPSREGNRRKRVS